MRPIALTGKMRSGKDAVAAYLVEKYGYTRFAFGDELKRYANELFDVVPGAKPRELYQWFGQTMRQRDPDIWVRKILRITSEFAFLPFPAVISDLRQPNEFAALKDAGYTIIRVNAPESVRLQRANAAGDTYKAADLTHETEQHVDLFAVDYDVYNVGTLAELHAQVDAILANLSEVGR